MSDALSNSKTQLMILALTTAGLVVVGLIAVSSATMLDAAKAGAIISDDAIKQALFALAGTAVAYVMYRLVPVRIWGGRATWVIWVICVALIILTAIIGEEEYGAVRRIDIGPLQVQPAELVKAVLVIMAAKTLDEHKQGLLSRRGFWVSLCLRVGVPLVAMLVLQSDLGSSMVCLVGVIAVLYLGGLPRRDIVLMCLGCIAFGILSVVASPYRLQRLLVMIDPWDDGEGGKGAGFQLIHSFYAISGGGLFGAGVGGSREKFGGLPIASTDFIFAVIAEDCGLFGSVLVIALFIVLLWIGLVIATRSQSAMGEMLAAGMTVSLVFQAFLNIASVIGVFPMTGKPLPFISYGGSSLVVSAAMIGLIASVVREGQGCRDVYQRRRDGLRVIRARNDLYQNRTSIGNRFSNSYYIGRSVEAGRPLRRWNGGAEADRARRKTPNRGRGK